MLIVSSPSIMLCLDQILATLKSSFKEEVMSSQMYNTFNDPTQSVSLQQKGSAWRGVLIGFIPLALLIAVVDRHISTYSSCSPVSRIIGIFCTATNIFDCADCWFICGSSGLYSCNCAHTEECNDVAAKRERLLSLVLRC